MAWGLSRVEGGAEIRKVWPYVAKFVQRGVNRPTVKLTLQDIATQLDAGSLDLWVAWQTDDAKAYGAIIAGRDGADYAIRLMEGTHRKHWADHIDNLVAHARAEGLEEVSGRFTRAQSRDLPSFALTAYEMRLAL